MATTKTFNFAPVVTMVKDELHGTGLQFALVVWRPGLPGGNDSVVLLGPEDEERADVLLIASGKAEGHEAS